MKQQILTGCPVAAVDDDDDDDDDAQPIGFTDHARNAGCGCEFDFWTIFTHYCTYTAQRQVNSCGL